MERSQEYARRAQLHVTIGGHDATGAIAPSLLEFTFTDNATGKADEVRIELHDREGHWNSDWKPKKGMAVSAAILVRDWFGPGQDASLPCGTFRIDELEFTGPPDKVGIKALSSALTTGLRDEAKTRAWETYSLKGVAEEVAAAHGLELIYQGDEHKFGRQDQRRESDLAFLNRLARERGMHCKVHDGKLILFDAPAAEAQRPGLTIPKSGSPFSPTSYSFKQSSSKTAYNKAEVAYTDPSRGTTHTATVAAAAAREGGGPRSASAGATALAPSESESRAGRAGERHPAAASAAREGGGPRSASAGATALAPSESESRTGRAGERGSQDEKTLQLDARVESAAEAMRLGKSALHNANAKAAPATLEIMGHPGIVAGMVLNLTGFGDFSGPYFVSKAEHKVSGSGGYTTSVELRKRQAGASDLKEDAHD